MLSTLNTVLNRSSISGHHCLFSGPRGKVFSLSSCNMVSIVSPFYQFLLSTIGYMQHMQYVFLSINWQAVLALTKVLEFSLFSQEYCIYVLSIFSDHIGIDMALTNSSCEHLLSNCLQYDRLFGEIKLIANIWQSQHLLFFFGRVCISKIVALVEPCLVCMRSWVWFPALQNKTKNHRSPPKAQQKPTRNLVLTHFHFFHCFLCVLSASLWKREKKMDIFFSYTKTRWYLYKW